jgi:DNA-binding GntR family transcriptional regulator
VSEVPLKAEVAYRGIRAGILAGAYAPGSRLVLDAIAQTFDISTVPVREAIRRLEAEGYVTFEPNVGAFVAMVDTKRYADGMEALAVLEAAATALSAPHLTKADLQRAERLNRAMARSLEAFDPVGFTDRNRELHHVLYQRCPNDRLLALVEREWELLSGVRASTFTFVPRRAQQSVAEHDQLIHLLRTGASAAQIDSAMRRHRAKTVATYLQQVLDAPDRVPGRSA